MPVVLSLNHLRPILEASEELALESIRDEIIWLFMISLDQHLVYSIVVA